MGVESSRHLEPGADDPTTDLTVAVAAAALPPAVPVVAVVFAVSLPIRLGLVLITTASLEQHLGVIEKGSGLLVAAPGAVKTALNTDQSAPNTAGIQRRQAAPNTPPPGPLALGVRGFWRCGWVREMKGARFTRETWRAAGSDDH